MTKKHEELVEEIRLVWCEDCIDGPSRYEYSPDLDDDACEGGVVTIKLCRERARECVAHILSAFRDGRLGLEEGAIETRIEMSDESSLRFLSAWIKELARDGYRRFIALSGTSQRDPVGGKEEE